MGDPPRHLFDAIGIELEYMIVDARSLAILPICDLVLEAAGGQIVSELEMGPLGWSNELVLHVIELKTNGPASSLAGLSDIFQTHVKRINDILAPRGGRLMPTACHPWMDPLVETRLWPHEYSPVYEAYDRIFGCRGHGWSNLQSAHINLPFSGNEEFAALHAAIRLLLPIMPALTASSPVLDGRLTGFMDSRMEVYRHNSARIPSIAGRIVPEPVYSREAYEKEIFQRMYADIAPFDPEGILQHEFLNSRGAIARFDRNAIEIRVLDVQESPQADIAIAGLIMAVLKNLCSGKKASVEMIKSFDSSFLAELFLDTIRHADQTLVDRQPYIQALGLQAKPPLTAGDVWQQLAEACLAAGDLDSGLAWPLEIIFEKGCLARRIASAVGGDTRRENLLDVYRALCNCLAAGEMFYG